MLRRVYQSTRFTKGQLKLQEIIESIGLETILEYPVGQCILDIYCPEINVAFEFDSPWHFSKKKDTNRDSHLLDHYNIRTMRIRDENLKDFDIIDKIKEFMQGND